MMPIMSPSFWRGETASVMFMPSGVRSPVPTACSRRPMSSTLNVGASAPTTEPTTMSATTLTKSPRVGNRWYRTFATGTNMAATSR